MSSTDDGLPTRAPFLPQAQFDSIVKRYSHRPGYELASVRPVALPVVALTLRVLAQETKAISAIDEFVLKAIKRGDATDSTISQVLGIGEIVTRSVLVRLLQSDDIEVAAVNSHGRQQALTLTSKGKGTLAAMATIVPEEQHLVVCRDKLTERLFFAPKTLFARPRDVADADLIPIPPSTRKQIHAEDLSLDELRDALSKGPRSEFHNRTILSILEIERRENLFRDDAVALGFRSDDGRLVEVAFVVDGQVSPEHADAYDRVHGGSTDSLVAQLGSSPNLHDISSTGRAVIGNDEAQAGRLAQLELERAESSLEQVKETLDRPGHLEDPTTGQILTEREAEVIRLRERLQSLPVRLVPAYEHPRLLEHALKSCNDRLLIVSPWITTEVVSRWFLDRLEEAMKRGARVYIGYGLDERGDSEPRPKQERALRMLEQLAHRAGRRLTLARLGDTHAKVLICDREFSINTSFNWLSFSGDPSRPFRDERGWYVGLQDQVDADFEYHSERINAAVSREA